MKLLFSLLVSFPCLVLAAPDEDALGKADSYPVCPISQGLRVERCQVGQMSHLDTIVPARRIARGASTTELRTQSRPIDLGVDAFLAANRNTGLLVMHGDTVLAERYQYGRAAEMRFTSWSMAKTLVAMLVGVALNEKLIGSIDDRAEKYLPDLEGHPYGQATLRELLTMSSGVQFSDAQNAADINKLVDGTIYQKGPGGAASVESFRSRAAPAGTKFVYASAETQVLGLVLRAATGRPLADYLSEKIWAPMGAGADATWLIDASGQEIAYCCINATLRDWARVGMLLANNGALNGKQIIPAEWVKAATTAQAPHLQIGTATRNNGYGYQTWLIDKEGRFALLGVGGQAVMVDPKTRLVVVHTAVHKQGDNAARGRQFQFFFATLRKLES
jgi:CubicO group peptidase (beta-lactamase class C family)